MKTLMRDLHRRGACHEAVEWAKTQPDPETLWRECHRGDWMLWLVARANVRRQDVVLAACACARLALPRVRAGENRPRIAIETAEAWARGDDGVTLAQVKAAADAAYAAADARDTVFCECAALVRARIPWAVVSAALASSRAERAA